ncbi:hypothetical protein AB6809_29890 [Paraburkholderia sp. RCC_158]|uniref:hypothetical protein n=1 Tax=Paraburkholderia sp. RCC_158 TaxID=3239220 RepID=UPI003523EE89
MDRQSQQYQHQVEHWVFRFGWALAGVGFVAMAFSLAPQIGPLVKAVATAAVR